jgi:hypothetical protein
MLFYTEHSPSDPLTVLAQLQAVAPYPVSPVVRPASNDRVLIKRFLDIGAQTQRLGWDWLHWAAPPINDRARSRVSLVPTLRPALGPPPSLPQPPALKKNLRPFHLTPVIAKAAADRLAYPTPRALRPVLACDHTESARQVDKERNCPTALSKAHLAHLPSIPSVRAKHIGRRGTGLHHSRLC